MTAPDVLIDELEALAKQLGRAPMPAEIDEHSPYSIADYRNEFGSWANALATADLEIPTGRRIPSETLLAELRRLATELGKTPSEQDMTAHGHHGIQTYNNRFGSWNKTVEAAGLSPRKDRKERSREDLIAEIERVAGELGEPPSSREAEEHGAFARSTYRDEFGSWNSALEAAGFESQDDSEKVPCEELLAEVRRLADEQDGRPTSGDMQRDGAYSPATYINRFGSWSKAVETAFGESESS